MVILISPLKTRMTHNIEEILRKKLRIKIKVSIYICNKKKIEIVQVVKNIKNINFK